MPECLTCNMREAEVIALRRERRQQFTELMALERRLAEKDMEGMRHDELVAELTDRIAHLEAALLTRRAVDLKTIKALGAGA